MTIEYDPTLKRSTHLESGLAVQWLRDDPPMERRSFFVLVVDGKEVPFEASYEFGHKKIEAAHPELSFIEQAKLAMALSEKNYHASSIKVAFDRTVFVEVWRDLVSQGYSTTRVSTYYVENPGTNECKEWSSQG